MLDLFVIFHEAKGKKLKKINSAKWSAFPEVDPVLGKGVGGGYLSEDSPWSIQYSIRVLVRSTIKDVLVESAKNKCGFGVHTAEEKPRLTPAEFGYLSRFFEANADFVNERESIFSFSHRSIRFQN